MKKITFKIYTLGCKVNQYDSFVLSNLLSGNGLESVDKNADIAIVNSCAVTKTAIHKVKRMLNKVRIENPKAKIILMGCWPKTYKEEIDKLKIDLVWNVGNLDKLVNEISFFKNLAPGGFTKPIIPKKKRKKARYFIKIQDGCEQYCTYCIVPYARGGLKSRLEKEIIDEIKTAVRTGYREIVLSGIHLGLFGKENKKSKTNDANELYELIKKVTNIKNIGRVRLSSIEVNEVTDKLANFILSNPKVCRHLHIPLQSGSNKILKKMNRPYNKEFFENKINSLRNIDPEISISTDVIVGFPDETEKDFKDTYNLIEKLKFSRVHIFPFSAHKKTPAAKMPKQVSGETIKIRVKKLRELSEKIEREYSENFTGKELNVVIEGDKFVGRNNQSKRLFGKTEFYFNVIFSKKDIIRYFEKEKRNDLFGKIVRIKI